MVEMECQRWASKGINITYQIRENRTGYKAGALKEGLKRSYVKHCEYVVIFDADFRPEPDFLRRAIPFLVGNPDIALVQARWRFGNPTTNFLMLVLLLLHFILVLFNTHFDFTNLLFSFFFFYWIPRFIVSVDSHFSFIFIFIFWSLCCRLDFHFPLCPRLTWVSPT